MSEFKPVALVSPDGRDYEAQTAEEYNNLRYGHGYSEKATKKSASDPKESK